MLHLLVQSLDLPRFGQRPELHDHVIRRVHRRSHPHRQVIDQLAAAQVLRDASQPDVNPVVDKQRPIVLLELLPLPNQVGG
jgi:acetolactate synthase regulatory subunit